MVSIKPDPLVCLTGCGVRFWLCLIAPQPAPVLLLLLSSSPHEMAVCASLALSLH